MIFLSYVYWDRNNRKTLRRLVCNISRRFTDSTRDFYNKNRNRKCCHFTDCEGAPVQVRHVWKLRCLWDSISLITFIWNLTLFKVNCDLLPNFLLSLWIYPIDRLFKSEMSQIFAQKGTFASYFRTRPMVHQLDC